MRRQLSGVAMSLGCILIRLVIMIVIISMIIILGRTRPAGWRRTTPLAGTKGLTPREPQDGWRCVHQAIVLRAAPRNGRPHWCVGLIMVVIGRVRRRGKGRAVWMRMRRPIGFWWWTIVLPCGACWRIDVVAKGRIGWRRLVVRIQRETAVVSVQRRTMRLPVVGRRHGMIVHGK